MQNNVFSSNNIGKSNKTNKIELRSFEKNKKITEKIGKLLTFARKRLSIALSSFSFFLKSIFSTKRSRTIVLSILVSTIIVLTSTIFIIYRFTQKKPQDDELKNKNYSRAIYEDIEKKSISEDGLDTEKLMELSIEKIESLNQSGKYSVALSVAIDTANDLQKQMAFISAEEVMEKIRFEDLQNDEDRIDYCEQVISIYNARGNKEKADFWVKTKNRIINPNDNNVD